ncbi:MAG TPA: PcfJ domain-containing protein [Bacteroidales bacterium]|nr:PcfJ domain-containing protein [Bacteroidales bacterium]
MERETYYISKITHNEKRTEIYLHIIMSNKYFQINLIDSTLKFYNGNNLIDAKRTHINLIENTIEEFKYLLENNEYEFWVYSYFKMLLACTIYRNPLETWGGTNRYRSLRRMFGQNESFKWPKTIFTEFSATCEKIAKLGLFLIDRNYIVSTKNNTENSIFNLGINFKDYKNNPYEIKNPKKFIFKSLDIKRYISITNYFKEHNKVQSFYQHAKEYFSEIESLNFKDILTRYSDEWDLLFTKLNYEPKRLAKYLFEDLRWQGMMVLKEISVYNRYDNPLYHCVNILSDYAKMSSEILKSNKFDKYPTFLKSRHDIVMMNYKAKEDEIKNNKFAEAVVKYEKFDNWSDSKKSEYKIVVPKTPNDLIIEGAKQHHCVASYIDDVCEEKTTILFVRYTDEEKSEESAVTLELKNNKIMQARRVNNNDPLTEEKEFIEKFCKKFEIEYNS